MALSQIKHVTPRNTHVAMDAAAIKYLSENPSQLEKLGIAVNRSFAKSKIQIALDAGITAPVTVGANGVPAQFLQEFLPGVIHILQKVRRADMLAPIVTAGDWSDEEIVITALEHLGAPQLYSDHGGVNLTSWNTTYERRNIIRHEIGAMMTMLDEERSAKGNINSMAEKRAAVAAAFEILRNDIFFNGFDAGANKVYGILNDPNLSAFVTVATGAGGGTEWASKTVNERCSDIITAAAQLRSQSGNNVDPENDKLILAVASSVKDLMSEADSGNGVLFSVNSWLKENYANIEVIAIPEFDEADGGDNVFYLYADNVSDSGTHGGEVIVQLVPDKMRALNTVVEVKGTVEGFTNALGGCLVKLGFAVVRYTGV